MDRNNWNKIYADRIQEVRGVPECVALNCALNADDAYFEDQDPIDAADEEMIFWDDGK